MAIQQTNGSTAISAWSEDGEDELPPLPSRFDESADAAFGHLTGTGATSGRVPITQMARVDGSLAVDQSDHTYTIVHDDRFPIVMHDGEMPGDPADVTWQIPLAQIMPDDKISTRDHYNPEEDAEGLDRLCKSIKQFSGLIHPIQLVWRGESIAIGNAKKPLFRVVDGKRRYHAYLALAKQNVDYAFSIPSRFIKEGLTEAQVLLMALGSQELYETLSLYDVASIICRLVKTYHVNQTIVGECVGFSQSKVSRHATIGEWGLRSDRLRAHMRQKPPILRAEHFNKIFEVVPEGQLDAAERIADFAAARRFSAERVEKIAEGMFPRTGVPAYYDIMANGDDWELIRLSRGGQGSDSSGADVTRDDDDTDDIHFWELSRPVLVSEKRVRQIAQHIHPHVSGTVRKPVVATRTLGIVHQVQEWRAEEIAVTDVVAALQAELDALYQELRRKEFLPNKDGLGGISSVNQSPNN